jgi:hypothetical protein
MIVTILPFYTITYKGYCYIASVNTKRDWLICSHVAKINAMYPARAICEKLLSAPTGYVHK